MPARSWPPNTRSAVARRTRTLRRAIARAAEATEAGRFKDEILPIDIPQKNAAIRSSSIATNRSGRTRPSRRLARCGPAFRKDGTVTAGNAPPVNDGAAALVVMSAERAAALNLTPMARIVGQASSGLAPKYVLMTPVEAVRRLAKKIDWKLEDVDLFELNEAFSVQAVAVLRELGIDPQKVNVNGGAVALGHPIGASGARILTTLLYALRATRPQARHRDAVPRRRQRRRARGRANLVDFQLLTLGPAQAGPSKAAQAPPVRRAGSAGPPSADLDRRWGRLQPARLRPAKDLAGESPLTP